MADPDPSSSAGRPRRVVLTGAGALAAGLAEGLVAGGAQVVLVGPDGADAGQGVLGHIPTGFDSSADTHDAFARAVARLGGVDQVVHTWLAPGLLAGCAFTSVVEDSWAASCEASLDAAWWLARAAAVPLRERGAGSMVFVVPTLGMSGADGFAMLAAVAEGLRILAKGCGRQWGSTGVTVNTVTAAAQHWVAGPAGVELARTISLADPALGSTGDAATDLAPLVEMLASPQAHFLSAATLVADGGVWMGL